MLPDPMHFCSDPENAEKQLSVDCTIEVYKLLIPWVSNDQKFVVSDQLNKLLFAWQLNTL